MALLLAFAGLRPAELCSLRISDVRLDGGYPAVTVAGRNNRTRTIPLCAGLRTALSTYMAGANLPPDGPLFPGTDGKPITYKVLRHRFCKWKRQAGLTADDFTLSSLRHSFARRLVGATDIRTAQQILGYGNLRTILKYAELVEERPVFDKQSAVQAANEQVQKDGPYPPPQL